MTLSLWPDWPTIEVATGSSTHLLIHTRRITELASFIAEHFELIPDA